MFLNYTLTLYRFLLPCLPFANTPIRILLKSLSALNAEREKAEHKHTHRALPLPSMFGMRT